MIKQIAGIFLALSLILQPIHLKAEAKSSTRINSLKLKETALKPLTIPKLPERFIYHSNFRFKDPDHVRGVYVTAYSAGGSRMKDIIRLIDHSDLNAVVIDIKDDRGNITFKIPKDSNLSQYSERIIKDPKKLLKRLEKHHIYPIARIVVFKDTILANKHPEFSFKEKKGKSWQNGNGDKFVNPFMKQVWAYNVGVAKEAAKLGFKEIQFDYVRFPEGFEHRAETLTYDRGSYGSDKGNGVQKRVSAITDFVAYAKDQLKWYDVKMSVDIFGYTATLPEAPGIGQNFLKISQHVDAISSMIYPSHWTSYFGIQYPDKKPYALVDAYAKMEKQKLSNLKNPPKSRPWIQDFTASWLGSGHYIKYGKKEVEAQIKALKANGIQDFLVWDASNTYTQDVDYTP